ncbi:hypothetical protein DFR72_106347 [Lentzea flaviverrucosa]|uniref:Uncharacterized protein n=1 Tax=Lentzea flaviverrucosa TaxID=200379 RepID=A0A1H9XXR5_9PSEU|nr:hypothetical protein DFR72_106347 [Lentzea flaviverrucosa]SES50985.1 hypothetical protein SAMN05216195_12396 [Lentzea flaviverrucosa]
MAAVPVAVTASGTGGADGSGTDGSVASTKDSPESPGQPFGLSRAIATRATRLPSLLETSSRTIASTMSERTDAGAGAKTCLLVMNDYLLIGQPPAVLAVLIVVTRRKYSGSATSWLRALGFAGP